MKMSSLRKTVFGLSFLLISGHMLACADEFLEDLKLDYGFANWVGNTEINYSCLVTNWVPAFAAFGVTNLISNLEGTRENGEKDSVYLFHPTNALNTIIKVQVNERQSVADAHQAMMEDFNTCSAIQPFPLGNADLVKIGDRHYTGYPVNSYRCVFFVRNNVFIYVSAGLTNYSVQAIATELDNELKIISIGSQE